MQPSSSIPSSTPSAPTQVPDAQTLRQALLEASWQRDRRVGQRRVALRWLFWGLWRCAPLALVLALSWASWSWLIPGVQIHMNESVKGQPASQDASVENSPPSNHEASSSMSSFKDPEPYPTNRLNSKEP